MEKISEIIQGKNLNWDIIANYLLKRPYHYHVLVKKESIEKPEKSGFNRSFGEYNGEKLDWRKTLIDGSCLHIREYDIFYVVHRDRVNPDDNLIKHIALDSLKSLVPLMPFLIPILLLRYNAKLIKKKRLRSNLK